jgi:putative ABC transport system permease protein
MEKEFSKRLRVGIGDRMVVDIQGIEMEAEIVNLRQVRWVSFQPNFFMLTQPGVLDEAPKTYLASASRVNATIKNDLVNRLTESFPHISVIDVNGMVSQLLYIASQLTNAFRFMAGLTLVTGLMTVIAIARQEALQREQEINLLRVLGASQNSIRLLLLLEFGAVASIAALTAFACSLLSSYALAWLMFDRLWGMQWLSVALLLLGPVAVCGLTAVLAANTVVRRKPSSLLH